MPDVGSAEPKPKKSKKRKAQEGHEERRASKKKAREPEAVLPPAEAVQPPAASPRAAPRPLEGSPAWFEAVSARAHLIEETGIGEDAPEVILLQLPASVAPESLQGLSVSLPPKGTGALQNHDDMIVTLEPATRVQRLHVLSSTGSGVVASKVVSLYTLAAKLDAVGPEEEPVDESLLETSAVGARQAGGASQVVAAEGGNVPVAQHARESGKSGKEKKKKKKKHLNAGLV